MIWLAISILWTLLARLTGCGGAKAVNTISTPTQSPSTADSATQSGGINITRPEPRPEAENSFHDVDVTPYELAMLAAILDPDCATLHPEAAVAKAIPLLAAVERIGVIVDGKAKVKRK